MQPPPWHHDRDHEPAARSNGADIGREDATPGVRVEAFDQALSPDPGHVEQDVDPARHVGDGSEGCSEGALVGDVDSVARADLASGSALGILAGQRVPIAVEGVIKADPIAAAVRALMATRTEWTGTASGLLGALGEMAGERAAKAKTWPDSPRALAGRFRRAATSLRKIGIDIAFTRE